MVPNRAGTRLVRGNPDVWGLAPASYERGGKRDRRLSHTTYIFLESRANFFRIPPPADAVEGKDAEASTAIDWPCAFGSFSSRWSRAWRLPVPLYHIGHSRAEKVTSEAPVSPPGSNRYGRVV